MSATVEDGKIKIKYSIEVTQEDQQFMEEMKGVLEQMQGQAEAIGTPTKESITDDIAFSKAIKDQVEISVADVAGMARGGPAGAAMGLATSVPFIAAIAASPLLFKFFMDKMIGPGGPLDRRFRLIVEEVLFNQRSRDHNWAVQKGDKQLIIAAYPVGTGPGHIMNNLEKIRRSPGRVLEHGIDMKGEGMKRQ